MDRSVNVIASGSGWPRGAAFIGALEALNENGIVVNKAIGTSGGGLVLGTFAAFTAAHPGDSHKSRLLSQREALNRMRKMLTEFAIQDFLDFNWWPFGAHRGVFSGKALLKFMREHLPKEFPDSIPVGLVSANVSRNVPTIWRGGDFALAMRATMSLPFVFDLVKMGDGDWHMDGGLQANFPIDAFEPEPTIGMTFGRSGVPFSAQRELKSKIDVASAMLNMAIDATTAQHVEDAVHARTMYLKTAAPGFAFGTSQTLIERTIAEGAASAQRYISKWLDNGHAPWDIIS